MNIAAGVPTGSVYTDKATTEGKSLAPSDPQSGNTGYNRSTADDDTHNVSLESTSLQNKVIVDTSESSTLLNNVAIGEVVTYRLPFVFPAGITRAVTIADELPDGLEYIPGTAQLDRDTTDITTQANPGGINGNAPGSPVAVTLVPATGAVTLYLGNVTSQNGAHQLILTLKCLVKNITTNNSGTPLNDRSRIQWQDDDGTPYTTTGNPLTVTVVEPIPAIDKTADPLSGEAGDLITFTLKLSNSGNATAFDWEFKDPLPVVNYADPQFVSADISNAPGAVVSFCTGETDYFNGNNLCGRISSVDPGEWVLITYTAKLAQTVVFGQTVNNTATFTTTSLPGDKGTGDATPGDPGTTTGERTGGGTGPNDLRGQDSTSQTILVPTMSKIILSPQSWYGIGAEVTYQITVGVPSGTTGNFLVKDELPAGLTYVDGSASVAAPAGFSPATPVFNWDSGTRIITWNFGTVVQQPPAGNLVITYKARVENILTNQDGVPLPNKATFTYGSPATSITSSKTITVGEPNLYLEKSPQTTPVALVAGATIRYRVEFRNDGHTTAYQANWEDVLPFVSAGPPVNGLGNISNPGLVIVTGEVSANNIIDRTHHRGLDHHDRQQQQRQDLAARVPDVARQPFLCGI